MKLGGKLTFQYQVKVEVFFGVNKTLKERPHGRKVKVGYNYIIPCKCFGLCKCMYYYPS
jgi:hypothetical protein